jgi:hypothetical protein
MNNDDRRNIMAPIRSMSLNKKGSSALNFRIVRLSPASVPGRVALIIGSTKLASTRFTKTVHSQKPILRINTHPNIFN